MCSSNDGLAEAYRANAEAASETAEKWAIVSREATDYLGESPTGG
jgi:hypothetical protein